MRTRLAAVALAAAFCAGMAVAAGEPAGLGQPLVLRASAATSPLLGLRYGRLDTWLVRLEPRTLTTLPGRKLPLGRYLSGWSFSPDRSRLAFGSEGGSLNDSPAALRIVDAATLTTVRDVGLGMSGFVAATHWVALDRVLALVQSSLPEGEFAELVDAAEGRVLQRQRLEGSVTAIGRVGGALVLLLEPATLGPVDLAVAGGDGSYRSVELTRIEAGMSTTEPPNSYLQHDDPGSPWMERAGGPS